MTDTIASRATFAPPTFAPPTLTPPTGSAGGPRRALRLAAGLGVGSIFVLMFLHLVDLGSVVRRLGHLDVTLGLLCGAAFLAAYGYAPCAGGGSCCPTASP